MLENLVTAIKKTRRSSRKNNRRVRKISRRGRKYREHFFDRHDCFSTGATNFLSTLTNFRPCRELLFDHAATTLSTAATFIRRPRLVFDRGD